MTGIFAIGLERQEPFVLFFVSGWHLVCCSSLLKDATFIRHGMGFMPSYFVLCNGLFVSKLRKEERKKGPRGKKVNRQRSRMQETGGENRRKGTRKK